jgi:drug/metabolite transporter (DMT)-like permease
VEAAFLPDESLPMTGNSGWPVATWAGLICTPMPVFRIIGKRMAVVDAASFKAMLLDASFLAALALYAAATLSWILVLRVAPLGAAYSSNALGFLFLPLVSWLLFGKALSLRYFVGAFVIIAGLLVMHA